MAKAKVFEEVAKNEVITIINGEIVDTPEVPVFKEEIKEVKEYVKTDVDYASELLGWSPRRLPDDVGARLLASKVATYAGDGLYRRGSKWKQFMGVK